jgi:hypothetical protein
MCEANVLHAAVAGSGKGAQGWFPVREARVCYDHPFHAQMEEALLLDFVNPPDGAGARVSVELSLESARELVRMIEEAVAAARHRHGATVPA